MNSTDTLEAYNQTMRAYYTALDDDRITESALILADANALYADYDRALQSEFDTSPETNRYAFADRNANDATVTAAGIESDRWHDAAEYANEAHEYDPDCDCDACEQTYADAQANDDFSTNPIIVPELSDLPFLDIELAPTTCATCGKDFVDLDNLYAPKPGHRCPACVNPAGEDLTQVIARVSAHDALDVEEKARDMRTIGTHRRAILTGTVLSLACMLPLPASAHDYPRQYPAFDTLPANCAIVREWPDDGSQLAYCPGSGETYVFDPDGQEYENAARVPVREPGWYPAPEMLQIGPGAPSWAR